MKIIDGKSAAFETCEKVRLRVDTLLKNGVEPCLAVIIVGDDPASRVYVNNKKKKCAAVGIKSLEFALPAQTTQRELLELIEQLNQNSLVNGILCQLPLPEHIDEKAVIEAIDPQKDVDCFCDVNVGKLWTGNAVFLPCTPAGVMEMLRQYNIEVSGKSCVIVGRSNIVGKPLAALMLQKNATVTVCHSKTRELASVCRSADILVAAVGRAKFITADMVRDNAVVIDVGINRDENGKLCGDVDFDAVKDKASFITPVPGGCGPMTIAMLMQNTVKACEIQNKGVINHE
ncbi:MAG: bifunctional methylenetetrahydrofolate dehydrogenase/methenyltetrahydrofolate cyclohydrolase FolD [Oscillospiraceae bacterium]|nr:bifunctional methylenetetrahydrofolate dehydrogenase/methenyltetrahydrofolate cyclohydrolase FolD [Oscillospiraceae bacterium]